MIFRYLSTLCLLWASTLALLGCGGAPDSKSTDSGTTGGTTTPSTGGTNTPSAVQTGVYFANLNGQDFWGIITPGNRWYGLHYATVNPDVYAGDVSGVGTTRATVPTLRYQNTADTVLSGSASLSSTGSGKLSGDLNLVTTPGIPPVSFNATTPTGFSFGQAAQLSSLAGPWTGQLSFGSGESANFSIVIASDSGMLTAGRSFASCIWNAPSSIAIPRSDANLFTLTLHMEHATNCDTDLDGKTLTGIAFVTSGTNNARRLIWVATTPEGHAIAFKAER